MDMTTSLVDHTFRKDVHRCFADRIYAIPARWLYDRRGSELFEEITELPEYYPTRIETALLANHGVDFSQSIGPGGAVIEFGSGSSTKTPHLLRAVGPAAYVPIDISGEFLEHSASLLKQEFPDLPIFAVEADFMKRVELPDEVSDMEKLGFFPGSTIGNMVPRTSVNLLQFMRETLGQGSQLLIGFDRIKDEQLLIDAYDDSAGTTAEFSLNLLHRINRELDGDIPVEQFRHVAIWNDMFARIEIYLEPQSDLAFMIDGQGYELSAGQRIHIENSHKYGLRDARLMLRAGGWTPVQEWSDADDNFTLMLAEAMPFKHAP